MAYDKNLVKVIIGPIIIAAICVKVFTGSNVPLLQLLAPAFPKLGLLIL